MSRIMCLPNSKVSNFFDFLINFFCSRFFGKCVAVFFGKAIAFRKPLRYNIITIKSARGTAPRTARQPAGR